MTVGCCGVSGQSDARNRSRKWGVLECARGSARKCCTDGEGEAAFVHIYRFTTFLCGHLAARFDPRFTDHSSPFDDQSTRYQTDLMRVLVSVSIGRDHGVSWLDRAIVPSPRWWLQLWCLRSCALFCSTRAGYAIPGWGLLCCAGTDDEVWLF